MRAGLPSRADLAKLVDSAAGGETKSPLGAYVFAGSDPHADLGRAVEQEVFLDAFGNTPQILADEYGRYEESSLFFCILDHLQRRPAGVIRIVVDTGRGLKSINDIRTYWDLDGLDLYRQNGTTVDLTKTWDIATLAVARPYQVAAAAGLVSVGLYQSVIGSARSYGIELLVAILDKIVLRMSRWRFSSPFHTVGTVRPYLGSRGSYPVYLDIADWDRRLALGDPAIHRAIYGALGMERALAPLAFERATDLLSAGL